MIYKLTRKGDDFYCIKGKKLHAITSINDSDVGGTVLAIEDTENDEFNTIARSAMEIESLIRLGLIEEKTKKI